MKFPKSLIAAATLAAAALPGIARATVYDLQTDWSTAANPNGVWTVREGTAAMTNVVTNWQSTGNDAYAPSNNTGDFLPAFFKTTAAGAATPNCTGGCDWAAGDLIVHTADQFNGDAGVANVLFTAPDAGIADISGIAWNARLLDRGQVWTLFVDGVQRDTGTLPGDGTNGSAHPDSFSLSNIALAAGDTVVLQLSQGGGAAAGDFVGYDLRVDLGPAAGGGGGGGVPEPAAWALMLLGFGGLGAALRSRRRMLAA